MKPFYVFMLAIILIFVVIHTTLGRGCDHDSDSRCVKFTSVIEKGRIKIYKICEESDDCKRNSNCKEETYDLTERIQNRGKVSVKKMGPTTKDEMFSESTTANYLENTQTEETNAAVDDSTDGVERYTFVKVIIEDKNLLRIHPLEQVTHLPYPCK